MAEDCTTQGCCINGVNKVEDDSEKSESPVLCEDIGSIISNGFSSNHTDLKGASVSHPTDSIGSETSSSFVSGLLLELADHMKGLDPDTRSTITEWILSGMSAESLFHCLPPFCMARRLRVPSDRVEQWRLVLDVLTGRTHPSNMLMRQRLDTVRKLRHVVNALHKAKRVVVVTGAGISVSAGIPDFRSPHTGLYAQLASKFPQLTRPTDMFCLNFFRSNPHPFYHFAKDIYGGSYAPTVTHHFLRHLEQRHKLLRNYSQNIDGLEHLAGVTKVLACHGGFQSATCLHCKERYPGEFLRPFIEQQTVPYCQKCTPPPPSPPPSTSDESVSHTHVPPNIIKPDIVFFGEDLPSEFYSHVQWDLDEADLLLVIGTSLKVAPVNMIPEDLPDHVPQILINREHLDRYHFDVELLGDCDTIVKCLCELMHWHVADATNPEEKILIDVAAAAEQETAEELSSPSTSSSETSDTSFHFLDNAVRCQRFKPRIYAFPGALLKGGCPESDDDGRPNSSSGTSSESDESDSDDENGPSKPRLKRCASESHVSYPTHTLLAKRRKCNEPGVVDVSDDDSVKSSWSV